MDSQRSPKSYNTIFCRNRVPIEMCIFLGINYLYMIAIKVEYTQKTIEGYLDSVLSLTFNTIKLNYQLCMHFIVPDICYQNEGLI